MRLDEYLATSKVRQKALATALKVRPVMVSIWSRGKRRVPAERCPDIERETRGRVRCEELRPDVDWAVLRGTQDTASGTTAADEGGR